MSCFTGSDFLTIIGLFIAFVTCLAALAVVPEIRTFFGLGQLNIPTNRKKRMLMWLFISFFIWCLIGALLWTFLCPYFYPAEVAVKEKTIPPTPTVIPPINTPTPDNISTPCEESTNDELIKKCKPVEVFGTEFTLYVFSKKYTWKKNTLDVLFLKTPQTNEQMETHFSKIHKDMKDYDALVGVGTASFDIEEDKGQKGEEDRAKDRAIIIVEWLRTTLDKPIKLYTLNLGHYAIKPDLDSQRTIIVFGVKKIDQNADINQIFSNENESRLREELIKKHFNFDLRAYSLFDIEPQS